MDIDQAIDSVLRREGGYVNNAADRGGPTNMGITQATLSAWLGHPASIDEVKGLTQETARAIYRQNYIHRPKIDQLPDLIQPLVFDGAVNSGPPNSIKWLQQTINDRGFGPVTADGGIGPMTVAAAQKACDAEGRDFAVAVIDKRRAFLQALVARDPRQRRFLAGWMNRCDDVAASLG